MSEEQIFREVEEEVRREQLKKLWDKYGLYLIGAAVAIVLVTIALRGYDAWESRNAGRDGAAYLEAIDAIRGDERARAAGILDGIAQGGSGGYRQLAVLRGAALKAETGDIDGAIADYDTVIAGSGDETLRDIARLRSAVLMVDRADLAAVETRLSALLGDSHALRHSAREAMALTAFGAENAVDARRWFTQIITDAEAPQNMRTRANLFLTLLGEDPADAAESDGTTAPEGEEGAAGQ